MTSCLLANVELNVLVPALIGVGGTLLGTLLGWMLQFMKPNKLIFSVDNITLFQDKEYADIYKGHFYVYLYNKSPKRKSIRDLKLILICNDGTIKKYDIQEAKEMYNDYQMVPDDYEDYHHAIKLIEIDPYSSINKYCFIEEFDLPTEFKKAYIQYSNEKFRLKRIALKQNAIEFYTIEGANNG